MKIRKYLGPQRLFVWHSFQGVLMIILAITGFGMYFADWGLSILDFEARHELHQMAGILMTVVFVLFFCVYHLEANRHRLHYYWRRFLHRVWIAKERTERSEQHCKPVVLSRYRMVMFLCVPIVIITGVALLMPDRATKTIASVDLFFAILLLHIISSIVLTAFTFVHVFVALINKKNASWLHGFLRVWFKL